MTLEDREELAATAMLDFEQRQEVGGVMEWMTDFPDEAAAYIVWLEGKLYAREGDQDEEVPG